MNDSRNLFLRAVSAVALAIILSLSVAVTPAPAQTLTVLYNFGGVPADPHNSGLGPIAQGRDGNLYATTLGGGSTNSGTIFKITPAGTVTVLSSLGGSAGSTPYGVTMGRDGNFYATARYGGRWGRGTVFQVTPEGQLVVLYSFANDINGGFPMAPPIQGADGNLYGTTEGDYRPSRGTIYKIMPRLPLATLYQFSGSDDDSLPSDPLLQSTDGSFYGTTGWNGTGFKISPAGAFTSLGRLPGISVAPLVQASNGFFYGATSTGGAHNGGTVFQMSRTGKTRVLHSFDFAGVGGYSPWAGLVQATDGNFYGSTNSGGSSGYGTVYRITPTGDFSVLHEFDAATGASPEATMVQHTNGILYGTTSYGGPYNGGTFFSLDIGAAPFIRLVNTFGKPGMTIGILGQGFNGTTEVSFNGIPATYTVSSDTYLEATVPAGATTGFVTVTTSTGTLTSNQQIQIRQ